MCVHASAYLHFVSLLSQKSLLVICITLLHSHHFLEIHDNAGYNQQTILVWLVLVIFNLLDFCDVCVMSVCDVCVGCVCVMCVCDVCVMCVCVCVCVFM